MSSGESTPIYEGASGLQSRSTSKYRSSGLGLDLNEELQRNQDFKPDPTCPLCGGYIDHLQEAYVGGAPINPCTFLLQTRDGTPTFRGHGQLRSASTMGKHLSSIRDQSTAANWLQFHGSIEVSANSKQLGKVDFMQSLNSDIKLYGLEAIFSFQALDGNAKLLTEHLHEFTLQCVMDDHSFRLRESNKLHL